MINLFTKCTYRCRTHLKTKTNKVKKEKECIKRWEGAANGRKWSQRSIAIDTYTLVPTTLFACLTICVYTYMSLYHICCCCYFSFNSLCSTLFLIRCLIAPYFFLTILYIHNYLTFQFFPLLFCCSYTETNNNNNEKERKKKTNKDI